ncbi:MAG: choice-of-anchor D domain-containing protein [bacterium]|nr:choice-of-anchor D domain-containing protein [bacterium]
MRKFFLPLCFFLFITSCLKAQTIVASYPFPNYSQYNSFWGITKIGDTLRIGTDNNGSIYKVTTTGLIRDSLTTALTFNHGLAWDGTGYWVAEAFRTAGARLFKLNTAGQKIDSIQLPALTGGNTGGVGDIELVGDDMWFSVYSPDFTTYPFAYAYKMNLTSRLITDTIPLRGRQVQGIAVKGDTIFYVNDLFQADAERIYAYSKATGDTLFSFPTPDPDGDCNPRGLYWDGQFLWLIADRIGNNMFLFKTLYKYSITGQGNPQITTSVNSMDFGNTVIGQTSPRAFTITNTGTAKLILSNFNIANPVFSIDPNNAPDTLNPGQNKQYTLKFTPTVFDTVSTQLRIISNDAVTPAKIVNLYGKGVQSGSFISTSLSSINYQSRRINSLNGGYFSITNKGTSPLSISSVNFISQRFRFDTVGITFPLVIDTQKTRQLRIWFNPNSTAVFSDTAKINSNAVNNSQVKISLTGIGVNVPTVIGDVMWTTNIPPNPNTTSNNYKIVSMKEIPDVNADGVNDVIASTDNYWTICYNGNSSVSGDILWNVNTRQSSTVSGSVVYEDAMQIIEDINSDGIRDVAIGTGGNNELVYAVSGRTGSVLWTYGDSSITADGDINSLSVLKDYNNDGKKDILVAATGEGQGNGRHAAICLNVLTGSVIFYAVQNGEFTHSITSSNAGGAIDFSSNGGPYGVNGFSNTGGFTWTFPTASTVWELKEVPDINGDGTNDIGGFSGFSGNTFMLSGVNGAFQWAVNLGSSIDGVIKITDDVSNDGFRDLVISGPVSLNKLDSKTGQIKWTTFLDNNYIHSVDELSDITGNGIKEIVAGTQNSNLYVLNGDSGRVLFTYNFGTAVTNTVEQVAKLSSVDGNFSSEFLGGSRTGKLICFSGGPSGMVGVTNISANVPSHFSLSQNYPNPFNPVSKLGFGIPVNVKGQLTDVKMIVYDALGKVVQTLVNKKLSPGSYEVTFDGSNFSSGIYFYELRAGDFREVKRMMLVK